LGKVGGGITNKEESIQSQLDNRYKQEEFFWQHNSRVQWICRGENNTKLFHHPMIHYRQANHIASIKKSQGLEFQNHEDMEFEFINFFWNLLT